MVRLTDRERVDKARYERDLSFALHKVAIEGKSGNYFIGAELQPGVTTDILALEEGRTDWSSDKHYLGRCTVFIEGNDNKIYRVTPNLVTSADKTTGKLEHHILIGGNPKIGIGKPFEFYAKRGIMGVLKALWDESGGVIRTTTVPEVKSVTLVASSKELTGISQANFPVHSWPESNIPQSFFKPRGTFRRS